MEPNVRRAILNAEIEIMNTQTFSAIIEGVVKEKRITYLDAVVWYCEQKGVEIETGAKLVNSIIKKKLEAEASDLNYLKEKVTKLPV